MVFSHFGGGLAIISLIKEAQSSMGAEKYGLAAGLFNTVRYSGSATGPPLSGLLLQRQFNLNNGLENIPGPYQTVFRVVVVIAILGAVSAALTPDPKAHRGGCQSEAP